MRALRLVLVLAAVAAVSVVCVRLGLWQLSRYRERQTQNADLQRTLTATPVEIRDALPPTEAVLGRRVRLEGRLDPRFQVVLTGRAHDGSPGVYVLTPFLVQGGREAVLVDRGWLYSADAATARPEDYPETGLTTVDGIVEPPGTRPGWPLTVTRTASGTRFATRSLDLESLAPRLPYPIARYVVRALPAPESPPLPVRVPPRAYDPFVHLSYAIQWFLFATILVVGTALLAWSRRRRSAAAP